MTTLRDLLRDFQMETKEMAKNDWTQEEEYDLSLEELIHKITERIIG